MAIFEINKQYIVPNEPVFQINIIKDMSGNDMSYLIDTEQLFRDHIEVKLFLAKKVGLSIDEIYVLEI